MAAVSLACPLRRSTRLAHARPAPASASAPASKLADVDIEHDSSSSDPENELTPRALRALKRQRLALDPDGLPLSPRHRPKRRRKHPTQHPTDTPRVPSPEPILDSPINLCSDACKPALSIPLPPLSPPSSSDSDPLTPLTPLTPSPESSPSLPGHDRQTPPISPPHDSLPPPVSIDPLPLPDPIPTQQPPSQHSFSPPLDPPLDTLIPFDGLHPQFDPDLAPQITPHPVPPQLQALELQAQFHSFPQHQLYVPPNPVFVRDREINIWKLACQERVDCLFRRYGIDYIKSLVESQARSLARESRSSPSSGTTLPSQTKFRLYTPASYTYSLSSWSSTSGSRNAFPLDDHPDDSDPAWPIDDPDWVDADVDMEDEDEDDYEDEDDAPDPDLERDGEATLEAVEALVITDSAAPRPAIQTPVAMDVDAINSVARQTAKPSEQPPPSRPLSDLSPRPSTPLPPLLPPPPPLVLPILPPLSSLHVPLLSEPPRAFMGRGTPPDRRRLVEWSGSERLATNGMGPPLYLSPVPQQRPTTNMSIIPMHVDPPIHPASSQSQPPHTHGEWTSFLYSMLEGDAVGVGAAHASEPTWYELGLASVPPVAPEPALAIPLTPTQTTTPVIDQPVDEGSVSSSTLRFALG